MIIENIDNLFYHVSHPSSQILAQTFDVGVDVQIGQFVGALKELVIPLIPVERGDREV